MRGARARLPARAGSVVRATAYMGTVGKKRCVVGSPYTYCISAVLLVRVYLNFDLKKTKNTECVSKIQDV